MDLEWIAELFSSLGAVRARRMFGGHGLFVGDRMFGLIADGCLYLKVDEQTRAAFERVGSHPFVYRMRDREGRIDYWTPPDDAFDCAEAMQPWARLAWQAVERAPLTKRRQRRNPAKT